MLCDECVMWHATSWLSNTLSTDGARRPVHAEFYTSAPLISRPLPGFRFRSFRQYLYKLHERSSSSLRESKRDDLAADISVSHSTSTTMASDTLVDLTCHEVVDTVADMSTDEMDTDRVGCNSSDSGLSNADAMNRLLSMETIDILHQHKRKGTVCVVDIGKASALICVALLRTAHLS